MGKIEHSNYTTMHVYLSNISDYPERAEQTDLRLRRLTASKLIAPATFS
jgi:hypothetical protein